MESEGFDRSHRTGPIASSDAADAMAAIRRSRAWLADRVIAPGWYHPAVGLLTGAAIAEGEARSWALFAWSVVLYTLGCGALSWINQRRVGLAMKYFDAATGAIFAAQVLTMAALIALACWLDLARGVRGTFVAAGVLAVALTVLFGRWTDRALRARMQAGR
jgi:hypothetical protein